MVLREKGDLKFNLVWESWVIKLLSLFYYRIYSANLPKDSNIQVSSPHLNLKIGFSKAYTEIVFYELIVENCGQDQSNCYLMYI